MHVEETDVLIVGGGPTGLALSIDLSWRGINHILIDKDTKELRSRFPRMDQVSVRTMEHLRRWGALRDVEEAGYPRERSRDVVFATSVLGYELEREPFAADAIRPAPPFSPQKHELCPQNFFDPALQRVAERSDKASVRYSTRLMDFAESNGLVSATVHDVRTGTYAIILAKYLAGADGANSGIARKLDLGANDSTTLARSSNIFFDSSELSRLAGSTRGYRYILLDDEGVWASVVNMDGRNAWRVQVLGDFNWPEWTPEKVSEIVRRAVGRDVSYTVTSTVPWERRELVVEAFSKGAMFLIGDAAHQLSPTGGYGMNTGIGDAVDISWKIAAVLNGWGGNGLLDAYDSERRPIAIRNARRATLNFQRMRNVPSGKFLLEDSDRGRAVRSRVGPEVRSAMAAEWDSMDVHLGYTYASSPLVCSDGFAERDQSAEPCIQNVHPGGRAPHAWLDKDVSTLDLFGHGFTLLVFQSDCAPDAFVEAAATRGIPIRVEIIHVLAAIQLYKFAMVLVRPDGHIAWRGNSPPRDPLVVLDKVTGTRDS